MVPTVTHLSDWVVVLASFALDQMEIRPDLPVDLFPADAVGFPHERHELLQVPIPINQVLCSHFAVCVDETGATFARKHFALLFREQLVAVCTLMQIILLLLQQQFQLLHKQPTHYLVFALLKLIQSIQANLLGHLPDNICVDATHVDLHA